LSVVVAIAAVSAGIALSAGKQAPGPPTGATLDAIRSTALRVAAEEGDANPTNGTAVTTSRSALANLTDGSSPGDDKTVIGVVLHGTFTSSGPHPAGSSAPKGSVLTLAIDASTNQVLDLTISRTAPDLTQLGPTARLTSS
jgi:hypothetical protein